MDRGSLSKSEELLESRACSDWELGVTGDVRTQIAVSARLTTEGAVNWGTEVQVLSGLSLT